MTLAGASLPEMIDARELVFDLSAQRPPTQQGIPEPVLSLKCRTQKHLLFEIAVAILTRCRSLSEDTCFVTLARTARPHLVRGNWNAHEH